MAIINVTPDSFSDGASYPTPAHAVARMREAIDEGADLLDVGGESTRPGAARIDASEQIRRVVPVIRAARDAGIEAPISVDTTLAEVAEAALTAGARIINDVSAGVEDESMLRLGAERGAGLVLMHRLRPPDADSYSHQYARNPEYEGGVLASVRTMLAGRADAAIGAGVEPERIVLDPGLGFGKSVGQNYELIARIGEIASLGFPLLSAASRKSFVGRVTGEEDASRRVHGSVAISVAHALAGVQLFRVHDVRAHSQALSVIEAILGACASREPGSE